MPTYQPFVITLPAGQTQHLIEARGIYSIPADRSVQLNPERYYAFRATNGQMKRIYHITLVLGPVMPNQVLATIQSEGSSAFPMLTAEQVEQLRKYILGINHGIKQGRIEAAEHLDSQVYYFLASHEGDQLPSNTGPLHPTSGPMNFTREVLSAGGRLPPQVH